MKSNISLEKLPNPELIRPPLRELLDKWTKFPEIDFIIIFGSRAIGDSDERSDIDISISAPNITTKRWLEIKRLAKEARTLLWITVVNYEQSPPALRKRNREEGVIVYERKKTN